MPHQFDLERFRVLSRMPFIMADVEDATEVGQFNIKNWLRRGYINPEGPPPGTGRTQILSLCDAYEVAIIGWLAAMYVKPEFGHIVASHVRKFFQSEGGEITRRNTTFILVSTVTRKPRDEETNVFVIEGSKEVLKKMKEKIKTFKENYFDKVGFHIEFIEAKTIIPRDSSEEGIFINVQTLLNTVDAKLAAALKVRLGDA
jgi:hypothetical protein